MKNKAKVPLSTLTDFDIHEVSLVDLAANKRRFLIAKRSEPMTDVENTETPEPEDEALIEDAGETTDATVEEPPTTGADDSAKVQAHLLESVRALQDVVTRLASEHTAQRAGAAPATKASDTALMKSMQHRLTRLEKNVGQPSSITAEPLRTPSAHIWPFDINSPIENGSEA